MHMRTIDTTTLQSRLNALQDGALTDVPSLFGVSINSIQHVLPSTELATRLLPFIGDALLTCLEQVKEGSNNAAPLCLKTITTDVLEYASTMDASIDTTSKKWKNCKSEIATAIDTIVMQYKGASLSENPKAKKTVARGTLDVKIAESIAGNARRKHNTIDIGTIQDAASWRGMASDVNAEYVLVNEPIEYRGMWRVAGRRTSLLTDCYITVLKQTTPILTSNSSDYTHDFYLLDRNGKEHLLTVPMKHRLDGTFASKLKSIGRYPTTKTNQQYFEEALDLLSREPSVIQQQQTDTLGWHVTVDGSRVFVLTNGCETIHGFLQGDKAPFQAPSLPDNINGYKGASVLAPSDEVMELLLNQLNTEVHDIQAALLGLSAYVMFPNTLYDGTLDFVTEIIGKSRRGKSVMLNFFQSMFGIDFRYNSATQLNIDAGLGKGNTSLGDLGLLSIFKYVLYSDADYKVKEDSVQDAKLKARRDAINVMIADKASGGVTSSRNGTLRFRANPYGAMTRQGNQDYAVKKPDEVLEGRVCTFIWPDNAFSNDAVSRQLEKDRIGIYSWGMAYRTEWIAHKTDEDLKTIFDGAHDLAYELIQPYTWYRDLHKKHTHVIVTGLLLWRAFLMEQYATSFMIVWIDTHIKDVITSRVARNKFIYEDLQTTATNETVDIILDAIRTVLHMKQGHLKAHDNKFLKTDSTPVNTEWLGYSLNRGYSASGTLIGYLLKGNEHIAFITKALYPVIQKHLKEQGLTIDKTEMLKILADNDLILTDMPNYEKRVRINKLLGRYMVMPFTALFSNDTEGEIFNDDINDDTGKVVDIATAPSKRDGVLSVTTEDLQMVEPD